MLSQSPSPQLPQPLSLLLDQLLSLFPLPHPPPLTPLSKLQSLLNSTTHLISTFQSQNRLRVSLSHQLKRLSDYPSKSQTLTNIDIQIQHQFQLLGIDIELGSELLKRIMQIVEKDILVFVKEIDDVKGEMSVLLLDVDGLTERGKELERRFVEEQEKHQREKLLLKQQSLPQQSQQILQLTSSLNVSKQTILSLQSRIQSLTLSISQSPSQRIESLSNELLILKKKGDDMMKMVSMYQNKTLDHQLENQRLGFELGAVKEQLEEMVKREKEREKERDKGRKMTESGHSSGGLRRMESSRLVGVRQVEEIEIKMEDSRESRKMKRIFGEEKAKKEGNGLESEPRLMNYKSSI